MADHTPPVAPDDSEIRFGRERLAALLVTLEHMASGDAGARLPITAAHDTLDAIAYAVNVLVSELEWAGNRTRKVLEERADELRAAVDSAEARNGALLKAIPDLMFVLQSDGTFVDYHARDPTALFVPPDTFLGKNVRDVLPAGIATLMIDAIDRAGRCADPVVVEYELAMDEPRFFEARIVRMSADRVLSIVREVTESKRAAALNRDLARRLISRQEIERQRMARDLHDDINQRIALLNIEIDEIAAGLGSQELGARLRAVNARAREMASDVHRMAYELHPVRLQMLGLVSSLRELCRDASALRGDLQVTFSHEAIPPDVDHEISLCLYRIAQEALSNAARHSRARHAAVDVRCGEGCILLEIADTGVGFDPSAVLNSSLGLVSMRERVAVLNGQLAIEAMPGRGTQVRVRIALGAASGNAGASVAASK